MKTKEYIKKYCLDKSNRFNHPEFIQDLSIDFFSLLEIGKAREVLQGYENAVHAIRMKWDAIHNKTVDGGLPEKLWKYFYAFVIMKLKEELFPKEMENRRKQKEERQRQYEERKRWENNGFGRGDWWDGYINNMFRNLFSGMRKPNSSFAFLDLNTEEATIEDVNISFRKLSFVLHPDHGGKQEDFVKLVEAKNKCLSYLNKKE